MGHLETLAEEYGDRVQFLMVYIREAHASDEWVLKGNVVEGIAYAQPESLDERLTVAKAFAAKMDLPFPIAVDRLDDSVGVTYGAWPERLYVIDPEGRIAYQGGYGPYDFDPEELEEFLEDEYGQPPTAGP